MPYNPYEENYPPDEKDYEAINAALEQEVENSGLNFDLNFGVGDEEEEETPQTEEQETPQTEEQDATASTTPTRKEQIQQLKDDPNRPYDMLLDAGTDDRNILQRFGEQFRTQDFSISGAAGPAAGAGLVDTLTDTVNLVPGVDIPKLPKFENEGLQAVRNISGLILPMRMLKGFIAGKAITAHKTGVAGAKMQALGNNRTFKWVSEAGLDVGTGTSVDYVAKQNEEDDNLAGMLKQWFPRTFQFIPRSIATGPGDSPDKKRALNVKEGALLSWMASLFEGLALLGRHGASLKRGASKFIPKDELAKTNLKKLTTDEFTDKVYDVDNPIADQVLRTQVRQQKELDNLGEYWLAKDPELTEPKLGREDLFDANESSTRIVDPDGIVGAAADNAQILNNIDSTYGRVGNVISEAALKYGLEADTLTSRFLLKGLAEEIKLGGKYAKELASGPVLTNELIQESGGRLAEILNDPRLPVGEMRRLLGEFKGSMDGVEAVGAEGYAGVMKSIKHYKDEFLNMDLEKARAYLLTSQAGQVSDIAEGSRLMDGTSAVARAQEQILDKLQYLMVEKGLASYQAGSRLAHMKTWKQAAASGDRDAMKAAADGLSSDYESKLTEIIPKAEQYTNTLRQINDEHPDFLRTFMLANEMTDGNIDSMYKLNTFVQNKLGTFSKAFYDGRPDIPSIMNRTQMSIIFNSVLSAFSTTFKALAGNVGGLIGKPASIAVGAMTPGMRDVQRRAWHQYAGLSDSIIKAFDHMKIVYRKASTDPTSVGYIMRDDLALQEVNELEVLKNYARAAEKNGEFGASSLLSIWEQQDWLARHPWLRFGANSMTALDGFNRAMYAAAEAKGRAFDAILESGQELTEENLIKAADHVYRGMFDENGMITDSAVDYATRESALNLDSELVKGLNNVIRRVPILRSIFMFPTTQMNSLDIFRKWSPGDVLHAGNKFEGDYAAFNKFSWEQYPEEEVRELLASKGIAWNKNAEIEFKTKQAEYRGRVAIGTTTMTGAAIIATHGRIRGNGHWDPETQRLRRKLGWKSKTYQGWDGKWYSYEWLGPIGDLIALSTDLVDNFDSMSTTSLEKMQYKLAFILGASITEKSFMQGLEPVNDMLAGNPAAWARWGAMLTNALFPLAGQRSEISRLIAPMKREYDNDVLDLIRNRNNFLDVIDPEGALPFQYNFVTGKQIGRPENIAVRVNNTYNPIKQHDGITDEEQFLVDIEYDSTPFFKRSKGGVLYDKYQRADLYSKIGEIGHFNTRLKTIIKEASRLTYKTPDGKTIKGFRNIIQAIRRGQIPESILDSKKFGYVIPKINDALLEAKHAARYALADTERFANIDLDEGKIYQQKHYTKTGDVGKVLSLEEQYNELQKQIPSR